MPEIQSQSCRELAASSQGQCIMTVSADLHSHKQISGLGKIEQNMITVRIYLYILHQNKLLSVQNKKNNIVSVIMLRLI